MKFKMIISIVLIIMLYGTALAEAPVTGTITPGRKVRISSGNKLYTGTIRFFSSEEITISSLDLLEEKSFSSGDISKIEAYMGKRSQWAIGALVGGTVGVISVAVVQFPFFVDEPTASDFVIVGSIGAVAGGVIGKFITNDRWEEVPIVRGVDMGFMPARGGGYLTLSCSF